MNLETIKHTGVPLIQCPAMDFLKETKNKTKKQKELTSLNLFKVQTFKSNTNMCL